MDSVTRKDFKLRLWKERSGTVLYQGCVESFLFLRCPFNLLIIFTVKTAPIEVKQNACLSQNYRLQNRKVRILHRLFLKVWLLQWRMKKVLPWPTRPGVGNGLVGWCAKAVPAPQLNTDAIFTPSIYLRQTCSVQFVFPFYSFLFCHL